MLGPREEKPGTKVGLGGLLSAPLGGFFRRWEMPILRLFGVVYKMILSVRAGG